MHIFWVSKKPQKSYNCGMANEGNLKPFKRGFDDRRNLKGRIPPTETNELKRLLLKYANQEVKVGDKMMSRMEIMAHRLIDEAVKGKMSALKILLDRTEGKAPTHEQVMRRGDPEVRGRKFSDEENKAMVDHFRTVFSEDYPTQ
jgi:hypothetical protein